VAALALAGLLAAPAWAEDAEERLLVNDEIEITLRAPAPEHLDGALPEIVSGWVYRSPETQDLQRDDFDNPGILYVDQAREVWNAALGSEGKSCASCHDDPESMRGVRPVYPKWDEAKGELQSLEMQINECLTDQMGAEAWGWDSDDMKNMTALLASVSRGMPIDVAIDGPVQDIWERGREMYYTRYGQLELSCASCHEQNYGNLIRADHLSQGHTNGFPVYRFSTTALVSQHNRFRGCIRDTRAETFAIGSDDLLALELYVASRGNGLSVEGPAVRH